MPPERLSGRVEHPVATVNQALVRTPTQHDVAKLAGVHRATVSRALDPRRRNLINPETVARVVDAAERLGYRPNVMARGLKTNRSSVIALVVPDISSPTYASIVSSLESTVRDAGYTVLIANTDDDLASIESVGAQLLASRVDGVVFASAVRGEQALRALRLENTPAVLIGAASPGDQAWVSVDHRHGIELAVNHLIRLGHMNIALICERPSSSSGATHHEAYVAALRAHGREPDTRLVEICEPTRAAAGAEACAALFYRGAAPSAIIATNDGAALGCYSALATLGLEVPRDVSIVGYGNSPYGRYFSPPLTTVALPYGAVGTEAANMILELTDPDGTSLEREHVLLRPYLVHRLSTATAPDRSP
jgi:LacI family transcriptional regulator, galactose operon repressor